MIFKQVTLPFFTNCKQIRLYFILHPEIMAHKSELVHFKSNFAENYQE